MNILGSIGGCGVDFLYRVAGIISGGEYLQILPNSLKKIERKMYDIRNWPDAVGSSWTIEILTMYDKNYDIIWSYGLHYQYLWEKKQVFLCFTVPSVSKYIVDV